MIVDCSAASLTTELLRSIVARFESSTTLAWCSFWVTRESTGGAVQTEKCCTTLQVASLSCLSCGARVPRRVSVRLVTVSIVDWRKSLWRLLLVLVNKVYKLSELVPNINWDIMGCISKTIKRPYCSLQTTTPRFVRGTL